MMVPSDNLKNLIINLYYNISTGKDSEIAHQLFSQERGFLAIGSGPNEWWRDADVIIRGYQARVSTGRSEVIVHDLAAFQEGTVGWVADRVTLKTPEGDEIPVRHTYIFHQEAGSWKIIHAHYSLEVVNEKF